jgi:hypothetical protein
MEENETIKVSIVTGVIGVLAATIFARITHKREIKKAQHVNDIQGMKITALVTVLKDIGESTDPMVAVDKFNAAKEFIDLVDGI